MKRVKPRHLLYAAAAVALALMVLTSRLAGGGTGVPASLPPPAASSPTAPSGSPAPDPAASVPAAVPASGEPAHAQGEHGVADEKTLTVRPTDNPQVREAAAAFTAAWLNAYGKTPEQWRAALTPRVTAQLDAELAEADPASVPSGMVGDKITTTAEGSLWNAEVPVVVSAGGHTVGTLGLTIVHAPAGWAVSEIDWAAAR